MASVFVSFIRFQSLLMILLLLLLLEQLPFDVTVQFVEEMDSSLPVVISVSAVPSYSFQCSDTVGNRNGILPVKGPASAYSDPTYQTKLRRAARRL